MQYRSLENISNIYNIRMIKLRYNLSLFNEFIKKTFSQNPIGARYIFTIILPTKNIFRVELFYCYFLSRYTCVHK